MSRIVTIGVVQMGMTNDAAGNLARALALVDQAAKQGAHVVCLPELFTAPYFCQKKDDTSAFDVAESLPGPTSQALSDAAKKNKIVLVGGSIFEKVNGPTSPSGLRGGAKFFNTTPVFDADGTMLGTYRKTHIPEDILYHEKHYFEPGDTGIKVFDTRYGKLCPLICYDQWYPEAARIAALKGAEVIFYPTAIGLVDAEIEENITGDWELMWRSAMLGHAASNCVYVCASNRIGREDRITFWGGSFIAGPNSAVIKKAGDKEEILIAECDLDRVKPLQDAWMFHKNRRPNQYGDLVKVS